MIDIICVNCGDKYPNMYVSKLYSMVERHLDQPFRFWCVTDRERDLPRDIGQIDCSGWGVSSWFTKIKLFDSSSLPFHSFLFLDITVVIKGDLTPLVEKGQGKQLVAIRDWNYDCLNSCVMWVQHGDLTQAIWDEYAVGREYPGMYLKGDQDYIDAILKYLGIEDQVEYFPSDWVLSYKCQLRLHRSDPEKAKEMLDKAIILKFHGNPRPNHLLNPIQRFRYVTMRYPADCFKDWSYLIREIKNWWR